MLDLWRDDVRYACRSALRAPGLFMAGVLALGLGIGANTAIFSVIDTVILNPIPFAGPNELVWLFQGSRQAGFTRVSPPDFQDWRTRQRSFEAIGAARFENFNIADSDQPERVRASSISWELFPLLRVQPIRGRLFRSDDEQPGHARIVLMGYGLWERRYGRDESVVGRGIRINGEIYTVVGIMPRAFEFPNSGLSGSELWAPLALEAKDLAAASRSRHELMVFGRIKSGLALETARAEMDAIGAQIGAAYPATNAKLGVVVLPLRDAIGGDRESLLPLLGAVMFVLLIACANVANLLLARATARRREMAIRAAVGATRRRIAAQLLIESAVLAAAAALAGLVVARAGRGLLSTLVPVIVIGKRELVFSPSVLVFVAALALTTIVLFGLAPALSASRVDLQAVMSEGGRTSAGAARARLRSVLVVVQVALSMTLLAGSALLIRRFAEIAAVAPGFRTDHLLTMRLTLPPRKYASDTALSGFHDRLLEKIAAIPGVRSAVATNAAPLRDPQHREFYIAGQPKPEPGRETSASFHAVSTGYFESLEIPLQAGRGFTAADRAGAAPVVILNAAAGKKFFPNRNPVGQSIVVLGGARAGETETLAQIVGIAADIRQYGLLSMPEPQIYAPFAQSPGPRLDLLVRTYVEPASVTAAIRQAAASLDQDQPVYNIATMDDLLDDSVQEPRFRMLLIGSLAGVALVISLVGIVGVVSYMANLRRQEMAVRMALGGDRWHVVQLFLRRGLALAATGVLAGAVLSSALGKLLSRWFFGVQAIDPVALSAAALVLGTTTLAASFLPAFRASKADPMQVLRHD